MHFLPHPYQCCHSRGFATAVSKHLLDMSGLRPEIQLACKFQPIDSNANFNIEGWKYMDKVIAYLIFVVILWN